MITPFDVDSIRGRNWHVYNSEQLAWAVNELYKLEDEDPDNDTIPPEIDAIINILNERGVIYDIEDDFGV